MAHAKSAKKRIRTNERNRMKNQSVKSRVKTMVKKFETAIDEKTVDTATTALSVAFKELDKAVSKGVLHKNTVARKKSRLAVSLSKIATA